VTCVVDLCSLSFDSAINVQEKCTFCGSHQAAQAGRGVTPECEGLPGKIDNNALVESVYYPHCEAQDSILPELGPHPHYII